MPHNNVTDHSGADVPCKNTLSETTIRTTFDIMNSTIFTQEYIMQLNDLFAMTVLQIHR